MCIFGMSVATDTSYHGFPLLYHDKTVAIDSYVQWLTVSISEQYNASNSPLIFVVRGWLRF